ASATIFLLASCMFLNRECTIANTEWSSSNVSGVTACDHVDWSKLNHCDASRGSSGSVHSDDSRRMILTIRVSFKAHRDGPNMIHSRGNWISGGRNGFEYAIMCFRCS